jgi:hypothetical protein
MYYQVPHNPMLAERANRYLNKGLQIFCGAFALLTKNLLFH